MADNTPNGICGVNAIGPVHRTSGSANVNGDQYVTEWASSTGRPAYSFNTVHSNQIIDNSDIVRSLIDVVNDEIDRYKSAPRHNETGGEIYYTGGSKISAGEPGNNQLIHGSLWFDIVNRVIALETAWGVTSSSIDISNFNKNDGADVITANYINAIANSLNNIRSMEGCGTVCKCNVVCACNGNCGCHYSDERLKQDIEDINPRLIDHLTPIKFKYTNTLGEQNDGKYHYGIRAQNLLNTEMEDTGLLQHVEYGRLKVNYTELIGIIIAEVQELRKENSDLKSRVKQLENSPIHTPFK